MMREGSYAGMAVLSPTALKMHAERKQLRNMASMICAQIHQQSAIQCLVETEVKVWII